MSDGGKGSTPRPFSVTNEEYATRWDCIFGIDKPKDTAPDSTVEEAPADPQLSSL